jgi:MFS family permease
LNVEWLGGNIEEMHSLKVPKVFYGYWIVVVAFFCTFIWSGAGWYCFSLFVKPLEADFGWGRAEIMVAFSILFLIIGMAAPFIGRVVDHYGARRVIAIGAFVAGLGFVLLSLMNSLWSFYLSYATIGVGLTTMGPVPATAVVSNWFKKRRGLAIGIMSTGGGIGGFALAPLVGGYLIPNFGWRVSYLALALLIWVLIIPLASFVIRMKPEDMGFYPDGEKVPEAAVVTEAPPPDAGGLTLRMVLTTSAFWLIGISFLLSLFSQNGVTMNQVPHLQDIGFPVETAATILGYVGLTSAMSRLGIGWLCDRIQAKYVLCISRGLQLAGIVIFMNIGSTSPLAVLCLYAIFIGIGGGSWLPTMSLLVSTTFGLASYGAIFGAVSLSQGIAAATAPLMAGYMYDLMNTYHWAFIIFLVLCAVSIPAILAVRRPQLPENLTIQ